MVLKIGLWFAYGLGVGAITAIQILDCHNNYKIDPVFTRRQHSLRHRRWEEHLKLESS